MKNLARIRWVLFSVAAGCGAGGAMLAACASDDIIVHPPYDASTDATVDAKVDTGTDAGKDTGPGDAGIDSTTNFDAGYPTLENYLNQITTMYCLKAASCCGEANFDLKACEDNYKAKPGPGALQNLPIAPYLDGGKMKLDIDAATKCYDDINRLTCGQTAGSLRKTFDDCVAGAVGTIPEGAAGCKGSPECVPPAHCELADGGLANGSALGTCRAPRPAGAPCDLGQYDKAGNLRPGYRDLYYEPQAQCGYLLTGRPTYCANNDTNYGWENDASSCQPPIDINQAGADTRCYVEVECATGYCEGVTVVNGTLEPGHCSNNPLVGTQEFCTIYQKDAGADGGGDASAFRGARAVEDSLTADPELKLHKVHHNLDSK